MKNTQIGESRTEIENEKKTLFPVLIYRPGIKIESWFSTIEAAVLFRDIALRSLHYIKP